MEQEIMQNANFEWLATLFVGIFSAFAGTFLGAVLLNHLQKSNMRKNRGTAVKALKILKKYDTKKYGEAKSQFNIELSISEKRAVLVLLHKMGIPIQIPASNKFDIKDIEFADITIDGKEINGIIDNGHGVETEGKRSPDGRLREYAYTREIADRVMNRLQTEGIESIRIIPEETDVELKERVARANKYYTENDGQVILVSIHCNAMGNGAEWMAAHGWSVFVDSTASDNSRRLATDMANVAQSKGVKVRKETRDRNYWITGLYICKHTRCPAVLVENFFQDNREDVDFLLSEEGKQCVTDIIVEGIRKYLARI